MSVRIINADAVDGLRQLPDESVHMVCTSPPYYGLRSYLPDDHPDKGKEIGLEKTPDEFIARLVGVFREVRRVLRSDGVLFVNIGDSYAAGGMGPGSGKQLTNVGANVAAKKPPPGMKPKDLIGIPWMLAFALRADGWYLRGDYIWHKPSCMPESVTDRCTKSHEYVFHLTKSASYFWDQAAICEPAQDWSHGGPGVGIKETHHYGESNGGNSGLSTLAAKYKSGTAPMTRNKRSVWSINPQPFKGSHFATMPPDLAETCIKAGTSEKGCCGMCGAPWVRDVERIDQGFDGSKYGARAVAASGGAISGGTAKSTLGSSNGRLTGKSETVGWSRSCSCDAAAVPCTVLDPFSGAGTTALVADRLQRNAVGIELHPDYPDMAKHRLTSDAPLFAEVSS